MNIFNHLLDLIVFGTVVNLAVERSSQSSMQHCAIFREIDMSLKINPYLLHRRAHWFFGISYDQWL